MANKARGLKIAVAGKGGVGKTTLVALLARAAAEQGYSVVAVDADPNPTLAQTLGIDAPLRPLMENSELIEERVGKGGIIKLNPVVNDLVEHYGVEKDGVKVLVVGGIRGGGGCACPASTLLRALLRHLVLEAKETVIVDLEAGVEHLGRATAQGVDALLAVVEPDGRSLVTARRIQELAREIHLTRVYAVGNKVQNAEDVKLIRGLEPDLPVLGLIPFFPELVAESRKGRVPPRSFPEALELWQKLEGILSEPAKLDNINV